MHAPPANFRFPLPANDSAQVGSENVAASAHAPIIASDPRWVLAARVQASLQGGTLAPERRARLVDHARLMGIRPFDAHVIIALVQDRARRGEGLASVVPALKLIDTDAPPLAPAPRSTLTAGLIILGASVLVALAVIRWILGA